MRVERGRRRGAQHRHRFDRCVRPRAIQDLVLALSTCADCVNNLLFALEAVLDVMRDSLARVPHDGAMPWTDHLEVESEQLFEGCQVSHESATVPWNED